MERGRINVEDAGRRLLSAVRTYENKRLSKKPVSELIPVTTEDGVTTLKNIADKPLAAKVLLGGKEIPITLAPGEEIQMHIAGVRVDEPEYDMERGAF